MPMQSSESNTDNKQMIIVDEIIRILETGNPNYRSTFYFLDQEEHFDHGWTVCVETKLAKIRKLLGN